MNIWLIFIRKEFKHILRDRRTMLILFGMPIVMMLLFGFAIRTDVKDVRTVVVTSSMDNATAQVVQRIGASEYFDIVATAGNAAAAEKMIRSQKADVAVVFSAGFASHRYDGAAMQILTDGADPNMAQQYASYLQQILLSSGGGSPAVIVKQLYNPSMKSSYNFVPGIMGMILMLICAIMTSISIVREKERGTMEVLLVSPVKPVVIVLSKAVPYMALSVVIVIIILLLSYFALGVPLSGSLALILGISFLYILLALSLGLVISNVANSQLTALLGSAMLLLMPCILLSGMMYPVSSMPKILQCVSYAIPATYYISAMRKLMIMGVGLRMVLVETSVLAGYTAVIILIALLTFKRRLE